MSKWSKSEPDTSSPFYNFCIQNQRNQIGFIIFLCPNSTSKNRLVLEQRFYETVLLLVGTGNLADMLYEKNYPFFFFSCFSLDFKCQKCKLVNLSAILNLGSPEILDKYCFDIFVSASDICRGLYIGFVPSPFFYVTQGVCNRNGILRREGKEETEEKVDKRSGVDLQLL